MGFQDIRKWYKVYTKTGSWFQKSDDEFRQLQKITAKSKKLKFDGIHFCPKINLFKRYIPSAKTLYAKKLTFSYLCENAPNYLHVIISFFPEQLLYIVLAQTLHTFYKSCSSKSKFSYFPLLRLKFTKFLMSFSSNKSVSLQTLQLLFNLLRHNNSSVLFHLNLFMHWTKSHQSVNFQTFNCPHEN